MQAEEVAEVGQVKCIDKMDKVDNDAKVNPGKETDHGRPCLPKLPRRARATCKLTMVRRYDGTG